MECLVFQRPTSGPSQPSQVNQPVRIVTAFTVKRHLRASESRLPGIGRIHCSLRFGGADFFEKLLGRQRITQQEALQRVTPQMSQEALLNSGFNAFGDYSQIQRLPYRDDGRNDGGVVGVMFVSRTKPRSILISLAGSRFRYIRLE